MEEEKELRLEMTEEEKKYNSKLQKRLEEIERQYQEPRDEWDGMTYPQQYEANEKSANTYIEPKKDKYDNNFQSGTVQSKINAIGSAIINLNLSPDISAFNDDNNEIESLGNALENINLKTEKLEGDKEKKILRQNELFKQGTVFVEEVWKSKDVISKTLKGKFNGQMAIEWSETIKKALPQPERNTLSGLGVRLGNIGQYFLSEQPDLFTVEVIPYEVAETIYGKWDRWKYVPKKLTRNPQTDGKQNTQYGWHITEVQEGYVEIIKYQNKSKNEFVITINGIQMTPIQVNPDGTISGLPFLWGWDDYNIVQQNLFTISFKFAYGKGIAARLKSNTALLDHMMRLMTEKTEESFKPAKANLSGRLLSYKMFKAGQIINGVRPEQVPNFNQSSSNQGPTNAEFMFISKLQENLDFNSVSPNFQGQSKSGEQTATESVLTQRQAEASIGFIVAMCGLLEEKLAWLRLYNILQHWFEPTGTVLDSAKTEIVNKYRSIAVTAPIPDRGIGVNIVRADDKKYTSADVLGMEKDYEKRSGKPTKITIIDPEWIKTAKIIWQITIVPKQEKSSDLSKVMFKEFLGNLMAFAPYLNIDWGYVGERFATMNEMDKSKLFPNGSGQTPMQPIQGASGGATVAPVEQGSMAGVPDLNGTTNMKV